MFRRLWSKVQEYLNERASIQRLELVDDRMLADIGVGRDGIAEAVRYGRA